MADRYLFGEFQLDDVERRLTRGDAHVHLEPKAHDLLVALVRRAGRLVTKQELLAEVWRDAFVEEGILGVHVSNLRRILGGGDRSAYIETVPRSGYRFVASVTKPASPGGSTPTAEVYEWVGRGRAHLLAASHSELPKAVAAFQAAIDLDPTFAAAHAGLALARCAEASLRAMPHQQAYGDAKAAALRALALDDRSADAQVALGAVLFLSEWDWIGAERSFERALENAPDHPEALLHLGSLNEALGRPERSRSLKHRALVRDPSSPLVLVQLATLSWHERRYNDAIGWARKALATDPRHLLAREFLIGAYWKQGHYDAFITENVAHAEACGASADLMATVRAMCADMQAAYVHGGSAAAARRALAHTAGQDAAGAQIRLAVLCAEAGDLTDAFTHLHRAIETRDPSLVHLAVSPQWDALRGDPRFIDRLVRMKLFASPTADSPASDGGAPARRR